MLRVWLQVTKYCREASCNCSVGEGLAFHLQEVQRVCLRCDKARCACILLAIVRSGVFPQDRRNCKAILSFF